MYTCKYIYICVYIYIYIYTYICIYIPPVFCRLPSPSPCDANYAGMSTSEKYLYIYKLNK